MPAPEIFFHCGLGKVGSTWLQHKVFPHFQGVTFLRGGHFEGNERLIRKAETDRVLISMGLDQQLEAELIRFAGVHPDARIILILRRPDSWIASQYRRYVKNGGFRSFSDFIDVVNDRGYWKRKDLDFYGHICTVEQHFSQPALVLFHEDMKSDPMGFIARLAREMGVSYDPDQISLEPYHYSYHENQLKMMRQVGRWLFRKQETPASFENPVIQWITRRARLLTSYLFMRIASILPDSAFDHEPLIPPAELERVWASCADNWARCRAYASDHTG